MKTREEWKAEQERLLASYEEVRDELLRIPGVVRVGVGVRERGGELADEAVYRVYVREKLPESAVPPGQQIPKTIRGFATDVIVYRETKKLIGFNDEDDHKNYPTKVGGIRINSENAGGSGTLGCFCRKTSDNSVVMLSNHHVLFSGKAVVGSGVGQPMHETSCCCTCNEIGKVLAGDKTLDCAIASLNSDVPFFPKIRRIKQADGTLELVGYISGSGDPVMNEEVWKIGARTGLTRGTITEVVGQIEVTRLAEFPRVANRGDSGSVIVSLVSGNVVALLHSIDTATELLGFGTKIADVLAHHSITVIPSDETADYGDVAFIEEDEQILAPVPAGSPVEPLVVRLRASEQGRELLQLVDKHHDECRELINRRRGFTIAWHTNRGPVWLAALARSAREPIYRVPEEIEGVSRDVALRNIVAALRAEASEPLRQDLDEHIPTLIDAALRSNTAEDALREVEARLSRV